MPKSFNDAQQWTKPSPKEPNLAQTPNLTLSLGKTQPPHPTAPNRRPPYPGEHFHILRLLEQVYFPSNIHDIGEGILVY